MRIPLPIAAAACLSLAGCLQMEQTIEFDAAGGGRQQLVLTVPDATMSEIRRAAAANQTGTSIDPLVLFRKDDVQRELADAGIELADYASESLDRARRVRIATRFRDAASLRKTPLLGSAAEWEFAAGPAAGTTRVTLYPQGKKAWADARARALAQKDAADAVAADYFARRKAQLAGLDVTLRFRLPGKVIEYTRNLELTGEREVTAHVTAEQLRTPEDLVRRLAPRFEVVFDSSACKFPVDR
jgi:hypothetical protein